MVYNPKDQQVIMFGGTVGDRGEPLGDTWAYDYSTNTCIDLAPASGPSPRAWHAMAYAADFDNGVILLFGGGPTDSDPVGGRYLDLQPRRQRLVLTPNARSTLQPHPNRSLGIRRSRIGPSAFQGQRLRGTKS